ncbi:MAG: AAA family ATPase, partial [Pseudomonadota bacterium]
ALAALTLDPRSEAAAAPLIEALRARIADLDDLGLGHLRLDRPTDSLSAGEARRVQLATCLAGGLGGLLYVLDEPSAGLHPVEQARLRGVIERLRDQGNTVVIVEHEPGLLQAAGWLVDVGPGAGTAGGRLLYQGPPAPWLAGEGEGSPTREALRRASQPTAPVEPAPGHGRLLLHGARAHNLRAVDLELPLGCLVALTGVSGAGKTTLAVDTLVPALQRHLRQPGPAPGAFDSLDGAQALRGVVLVDAAPIGRSPRSNAGTYTGIFDAVRALFARQPLARERGFSAGRFSFNTAGGRCERCEGAGSLKVGMHFLPDVHVPCPACGGARFDADTLAVRYRGKSVHDVLELPAAEALALFADEPAIARGLAALVDLGLGYLPLGQPATTLSGGEARRVKLAAHLARPPRGATLYVLDEPSTGLHPADLTVLIAALRALVAAGHSVLVADHDLDLLLAADWIVDLGPDGGEEGGRIVGAGTPAELATGGASPTARALAARIAGRPPVPAGAGDRGPEPPRALSLRGVATHNLAGIDLDLPHGALTVITGVSGSGKSSLAFDTLHAEAWRRFGATLPGEARRRLRRMPRPTLTTAEGLLAPVAVGQRPPGRNPRSTLGSLAGVLPALRLLYARFGERHCPGCGVVLEQGACPRCGAAAPALTAGHFSFNREIGACPACDGLGRVPRCDPEAMVSHPELALGEGALQGSRFGRYLEEPEGQHLATLAAAAAGLGLSVAGPWRDLCDEARRLALEGSGARIWEVRWRYRRGKRAGEHAFSGPWPGLSSLVEAEWARVHADGRAADLDPLMAERPCATCGGERLAPWPRAVRLGGMRLGELGDEPATALLARLRAWEAGELPSSVREASAAARALVAERLVALVDLGLGYLTLHRASDSLSGGELRRAQLAGLLASGLSGLQCVLDEPTQGLHPRDVARLVVALRGLAERGNAVVVVEHELQVIAAADHVLELGPGAGVEGGRIVAQGSPAALCDSLTGAWLAGRRALPLRFHGPLDGPPIILRGMACHNLRDLDLILPTRGLAGICGVSGSGKSTLLFEVLEPSARQGRPVACREATGLAQFREVVTVDARPPGDAALSTPATLAGLLAPLAAHFAAHADGLRPADLSYTSPRGRCPACGGSGRVAVGLELLADAWLPCEACGGARLRPEALAVRVNGMTIAEALALSVDAAAARFGGVRGLGPRLAALAELGLGYLPLGQPAATLSGGEARRLRLALALLEGGPGPRLFLLDEPSAGLHPEDLARLLPLLDRLVRAGHTVILVDHDPGLLLRCDHVVELGPEGGPGGGRVIYQGAPRA